MPRKIVRDDQLRSAEVLAIEVDDALLRLQPPLLAMYRSGEYGMPLTPHAEVAYVDKRHVGIAIIAPGHPLQEGIQLLQEYRVVIFRLLVAVHLVELRPRAEHPLRRTALHPVLGGGDAECHPLARLYPSLCGCIQNLPVVLILAGLDKRPRQSQIHGTESGKVIEHIARRQFGAIVAQQIGVEVHGPSHAGIDQRLSVVLQACFRSIGHGGSAVHESRCHKGKNCLSHHLTSF